MIFNIESLEKTHLILMALLMALPAEAELKVIFWWPALRWAEIVPWGQECSSMAASELETHRIIIWTFRFYGLRIGGLTIENWLSQIFALEKSKTKFQIHSGPFPYYSLY